MVVISVTRTQKEEDERKCGGIDFEGNDKKNENLLSLCLYSFFFPNSFSVKLKK
jgi:hypothetical protein